MKWLFGGQTPVAVLIRWVGWGALAVPVLLSIGFWAAAPGDVWGYGLLSWAAAMGSAAFFDHAARSFGDL